ncbi:hypothetical protein [Micromonospora eburnea]|nr:hypothetical protein [Micromonospora eburnea]
MSKSTGRRNANPKIREVRTLQPPSPIRRGPVGPTTAAADALAAVTPPNLALAADPIDLPAPAGAFRSFWMIGREPAWCVFGHFNDDTLADRRHEGLACQLRLSLAEAHDHGPKLPPNAGTTPLDSMSNSSSASPRQSPPSSFTATAGPTKCGSPCTLAEAADLADRLVAMTARAEVPLGDGGVEGVGDSATDVEDVPGASSAGAATCDAPIGVVGQRWRARSPGVSPEVGARRVLPHR